MLPLAIIFKDLHNLKIYVFYKFVFKILLLFFISNRKFLNSVFFIIRISLLKVKIKFSKFNNSYVTNLKIFDRNTTYFSNKFSFFFKEET